MASPRGAVSTRRLSVSVRTSGTSPFSTSTCAPRATRGRACASACPVPSCCACSTQDTFAGADVSWVEQAQQLGTGHALAQALPRVARGAQVLVLNGDVPLVRTETLRRLVETAPRGLAICTSDLTDPAGYGRVVRDAKKRVLRIVEHKDASARELRIREWYAGFLAAPAARLAAWLSKARPGDAQTVAYLAHV